MVWTNGCFDNLHPGHIEALEQSKAQGHVLIVGLNSDVSVRALKGPDRPKRDQMQRARMVAALECVTCVVVFDETTPEASIRKLQPEVHCKGEKYRPPDGLPIPERELVESYGGRVCFTSRVPGISTSEELAAQ